MSSTDAKHLLATQFPNTAGKDWKRISKNKTDGGYERVFQHPREGQATVFEDAHGHLQLTGQQENSSLFVAANFTPEQVAAARTLLVAYNRMARNGDDDALDKIKEHALFVLGGAALGTQLAFYFPSQTYGNEDGRGKTLDDPIGECCVMLFDPTPGSDPDLYANNLILDALVALDLDMMDEYHLECRERTRTVKEFVQNLIGLGVRYMPHHPDNEEACLFELELRQAGALTPRSGGSTARHHP